MGTIMKEEACGRPALKSLDVIKAIAFLFIFLSHIELLDGVYSRWGVALFFVLSGFLNIYHGFNNDGNVSNKERYVARKIEKIFPLHVVTLIFAIIAVGIQKQEKITLLKVLTNLLLVSDWVINKQYFEEYNIVTWFLSALLFYWLLTPQIVKTLHRLFHDGKKIFFKSLLCIGFIYLFVVAENLVCLHMYDGWEAFRSIYQHPLSRIGDYFIGAILGVIYLYIKQTYKVIEGRVLSASIMLMLLSIMISAVLILLYRIDLLRGESWLKDSGFFFTFPVGGLVLASALFDGSYIGNRIKQLKIVDFWGKLGKISSSAFLIHVVVINYVHAVYKRIAEVRYGVWFVVSFVITVVTSIIWQWFKRNLSKKNV